MRLSRLIPLCLLIACGEQELTAIRSIMPMPSPNGHFKMERLDRGLVAVATPSGIFLSWRLFGYEHDPDQPGDMKFDVYRDNEVITTVYDSTNFLDSKGNPASIYRVAAVFKGSSGAPCDGVKPWTEPFLRIPLQIPPNAAIPADSGCENAGETYQYNANDGTVGDLDGDGRYDIVLKWDPSNSRDNIFPGCTGHVLLDGYTLNGHMLWRIDLGPNIRAGAFYTQPLVYDFDGDGKAEIALKTAPGSRDGKGVFLHTGPAANDDDGADFRNIDNTPGQTGFILSGPEYLTVFDGATGAELATVPFEPARGDPLEWGDDPTKDRGNRVDRFFASVAFLRDQEGSQPASGRPGMVFSRGLARTALAAYTWRDGQLSLLWKADSQAGTAYAGKNAYGMMVADVDGDGAQEIIQGSATMNGDGTKRCATDFGGGRALHVGDFLPNRPGIEVFVPHFGGTSPTYDLHDGNTCEVLAKGPIGDADRGVIDDIYIANDGAEMWTNESGALISASGNTPIGPLPAENNFVVWWDGDEIRELENQTYIRKYGSSQLLLSCNACASNNGSKSTPTLTADLLGDWREEIIWREMDNSALRLYTTTYQTKRRLFTLMHDPQYRMQVSAQQSGFNQPPHPGFPIGHGMRNPSRPDIITR